MLNKIRSLSSYHLQAASSSLNLLCHKPLATMMTVIVIAIALTLPALFWVFTDNLDQLTRSWQRGGHISLYLKPALSGSGEAGRRQAGLVIGASGRVSPRFFTQTPFFFPSVRPAWHPAGSFLLPI